VSYLAASQLNADPAFNGRTQSAATEQAEVFFNDARPPFVATAKAVLMADPAVMSTFTRMAASGPGIADKADLGDGTIDQALVLDDDLLALTQANWQVVAGLYFDADGKPIP